MRIHLLLNLPPLFIILAHHCSSSLFDSINCVWTCSSEPAVPREEDEAATASPVQEPPEAEKEGDALEVKAESVAVVESQTDAHTHEEQTEKSSTPAPPTTEPTSDPTPAAPEENRVGRTSGRLSAGHMTSKASSKTLLRCSHSPGPPSPARTSRPAEPSLSQESPPTSSKSSQQHQ